MQLRQQEHNGVKRIDFRLKEKEKEFYVVGALVVFSLLALVFVFSFGDGSFVLTGFFVVGGSPEPVFIDEPPLPLNPWEKSGPENFPEEEIDVDYLSTAVNNSTSSGGGGGRGTSDSDFLNEEIIITRDFIVSIVSPKSFGSVSNDVTFYYLVEGENSVSYCSLYIDEILVETQEDVERGVTQSFFVGGMDPGDYSWEIVCEDWGEEISVSSESKVKIFHSFSGIESSLFMVNDIENIENLFFRMKGFGEINFTGSVNLSEAGNFSKFIFFGDNLIGIDSENAPYLDQPAILTLFNLPFSNPIILRNGKPCPDCQILSYDGNLVFSVSHFSNYSASENSQLRIWDDTDFGSVFEGETVAFYANYSNVTDGSPITGATCNIGFSDGSGSMDYNAGSGYYEYNRTFSSAGDYSFSVECSAAGYTTFNLSDTSSIGRGGKVRGASVTALSNDTAALDPAGSHAAVAGNITELNLNGFSVTQSWQGYYGNVTGTIELADSSGNVLYNWSQASAVGEVFAAYQGIDWQGLSCFDMSSQLSSLEAEFNIGSSDVDGVDETFTRNDHAEFYVGTTQFSSGECNNTKVNGPGGAATYDEVLLMDSYNRTVFTALLSDDTLGFDNQRHDFEMLVLEDGHGTDTDPTIYFFYIELG